MKYNQIPIDEDTFHQICGNDNYDSFLKDNPSFCLDFFRTNKDYSKEKASSCVDSTDAKKDDKKQSCTSTEDFKNFMMLTWLELYLPRYEFKYGLFEYSDSNLSSKEKISELLDYYGKHGITNIEQIRKNSIKGFRH